MCRFQDCIEVVQIIDDNGGSLNTEESESRCSIGAFHLGTEEAHISSNFEEEVICTKLEAQQEEVIYSSLNEYGGLLEEVDMKDA